MLSERHWFPYRASVPWPNLDQDQLDWERGIRTITHWLEQQVGPHLNQWAWDDGRVPYHLGVGFRWDQDRLLFVLRWS